MIKYLLLSLLLVFVPSYSNAQIITAEKNTQQKTALNKDATLGVVSEEELLEEELPPPPTKVSVEEIVALETDSKKMLRKSVRKQEIKDREGLVGSMKWSEQMVRMKDLMSDGMSYADAKKQVEEEIKKPNINVKKDEEFEKYLHEKGKFISNDK